MSVTPGGKDLVALIEDDPALVVDLEHWHSPYARLATAVRDPYRAAALLRQNAKS